MCGRYYVDDDTAREIEKMVRNIDKKIVKSFRGDICPSEQAFVLSQKNEELTAEMMYWGFPGFEKHQVLINARAEGILEKKTFRNIIRNQRCVIPAKGFYEWNARKEKFKFERSQENIPLYMAGTFQQFYNEKRFVIITTQANASVSSIHQRMPLILDKKEVEDWIFDWQAAEFLLHKIPAMLQRYTDYEQMRLF